ncbi:putative translation protein SH3 [Medicago truncatula]|uniref:Putative translation protein SH3 n=1 Tax=Medicago truncatula TaxID=3880 RepID=A0A396GYS5_MEDTR|nr:putative translation protein SH3 [Medicago truncatula]
MILFAGREKEAVIRLMQKRMQKCTIFSAFVVESLPKCVYVEAHKESDVKEACKGVQTLYCKKIIAVPMNEMNDLMTLASKSNKEEQNFTQSGESGKKQQFRKGDIVMVTDGETEGKIKVVDKVEEGYVLIRAIDHLSVSIQSKGSYEVQTSQIRKHFKEGDRVKVVSGTDEGETGFVVKVDQHDHLVLFTDTRKEICVLADDAVLMTG